MAMLCMPCRDRWPLPGRKVKNALRLFLWAMTPLMIATNIAMVAMPRIQRARLRGRPQSSK